MTVESVIRSRVLSLAGVTALAGTRVYLDQLPQTPTYPAVVVQLIDDSDTHHLRGPDDVQRARVQVDAYTKDASGVDKYAQATQLAQAIHGDGLGTSASGLSGWCGSVGSPAFEIKACFRVNRMRQYDPDELRVLTIMQDYDIWYRA